MEDIAVLEFLTEMENEEKYWEGQDIVRNLQVDEMIDQYEMEEQYASDEY